MDENVLVGVMIGAGLAVLADMAADLWMRLK